MRKIYILNKDLELKKITKLIVSIILVLLFVILALISFTAYNSYKIIVVEKEIRFSLAEKDKFTSENFKEYLYHLNIKFPDIVYNQARLETANFTSKVFLENNNLFGMKLSTSRPTTSNEVENGYASYKNWHDSAIDFSLYQSKYLSDFTREQYLNYIGKNYASDSLYINKIINF
ncbi:MAG TPA: glucosaminidase domain-containing protein [Candidatus Paceibacterota bacterium]